VFHLENVSTYSKGFFPSLTGTTILNAMFLTINDNTSTVHGTPLFDIISIKSTFRSNNVYCITVRLSLCASYFSEYII